MIAGSNGVVLFLDVDGPLIPFGGVVREYSGAATARAIRESSNPLLARINPELGPHLLGLGCELVWATTWMDDANRYVGPILGLPPLGVMNWPDADDPADARHRWHWKTRALVNRAAGQPFIWIDDEIGEFDQEWVAGQHGARALLHRVDPRVGLTSNDIVAIGAWLT